MQKKKTYAVFGLGRYGIAVAKELVGNGMEVIAVDSDQKLVNGAAGSKISAAFSWKTFTKAIDRFSKQEYNVSQQITKEE